MIKTIILLILGCSHLVIGEIKPLPNSEPSRLSPFASNGLVCLDSETLAYRIGDDVVKIGRCVEIDPKTPYCDEVQNKCTKTPISIDPPTCRYDGYFPHPLDCNKYYQCENTVSYLWQCMENYTYDHETQTCSMVSKCYTYASTKGGLCEGRIGSLVLYPKDASIYGICQVDDRVSMLFCPSKNYVIDLVENECRFQCPAIGLYEDVKDVGWFYLCIIENGKLRAYHRNCPSGLVFDVIEKKCVSA